MTCLASNASAETAVRDLSCTFTGAASHHHAGSGTTEVEPYPLPHAFFADFSMRMTDQGLEQITIERWASYEAQQAVGLMEPFLCRVDLFTAACTGHFGNYIFLDRETLTGTAIIPSNLGLAGELVVSFFRCQPTN